MFTDYYAILGISETASADELKKAYRKMALKYHPDRNIGIDTNDKMKKIIEANQILEDKEARRLYDIEYKKYKTFKNQSKPDKEYTISDDTLQEWMNNAKEQANELFDQVIADFGGVIKSGKDGCSAKIGQYLIWIIGFLLAPFLLKMCSALLN